MYDYWFIQDYFPDDLYLEMIENLPEDSKYRRYNYKYRNRYLYDMSDDFWGGISDMLKKEYGNVRIQMCRDFPGYKIGPHTDGKEYSTLLFYLTDREYDCGTCIYEPLNKDFTSDGTQHFDVSGFRLVEKAPYKPNSGFGFIRSDNSFHGVEETDIVRNLIQVTLWQKP